MKHKQIKFFMDHLFAETSEEFKDLWAEDEHFIGLRDILIDVQELL